MQIGILGSLRVITIDGAIEIRARQQRILLAALAVHVDCTVHSEQLAVAIWGDPLPAGWRQMLPPLIRRLRVSLGGDGWRIATTSPGYRLGIEPQCIDIWAFDALRKDGLAAAQAGDWRQASRILAEAETLWRGAAFADIESAELHNAWQRYLADQRFDVQETRLEADVRFSLSTARAAVPDLRNMIAATPASERLRWLLMLALQRSGRQADAQAAFRDAWDYSASELAGEPGPALRTLNQCIIAADPRLLSEPFEDITSL